MLQVLMAFRMYVELNKHISNRHIKKKIIGFTVSSASDSARPSRKRRN